MTPTRPPRAKVGFTRRVTVGSVAAAAALIGLVGLALAGHTGSAASEPAMPPLAAPPPCPVAAGGSGVDCGPASAAIRTAGAWQVIDQGRCIDRARLYFGAHTQGGDAPLSLIVEIPQATLVKGGDVRVTDGQLVRASGAKEPLSGLAVIAPGGNSGAFTVHGRDAQGKHDGAIYAGAWTCRAGQASQQASSQQIRRARLCTHKEPGAGYTSPTAVRDRDRITCGPGSAILWVGGRWQFVFPGGDCGSSDLHFHGYSLWFHPESLWTDLPFKLAQGVSDGGMTVAGTHAAFSGRVIFQPGQVGGAFDLNNRASPSSPDRADYVGAWACGSPNS